MPPTQGTFDFLFHHIILPPKLPQQRDEDETENGVRQERKLHEYVLAVLQDFINKSPSESRAGLNLTHGMLRDWLEIQKQDGPCEKALAQKLSDLRFGGAVALYIRAQNCGWIGFHDTTQNQVIFDAFEVSPRAKDVLSAQGSLLRRFPGQSVAIPSDRLSEATFCSWLARDLARLSTEAAGRTLPEERDTAHPGLVTECLMTQLLAFGERNQWPAFEKHMRDEVNWDSSKLPWRRSPYWFVMRATSMRPTVSADHLEIVRMKIARRICKLQSTAYEFVAKQAHSTVKVILKTLQDIQATIHRSDRVVDLQMSLTNCSHQVQTSQFSRTHHARDPRNAHGLPTIRKDKNELGSWTNNSTPSENYYRCALAFYTDSPEAMSLMVLTMLELWMALDRMCIKLCPLLKDYSPEIPADFLEPLLLPQRSQMERACKVEDYIRNRHREAGQYPRILQDPSPQCFAARYYDASQKHQQLRSRIEEHARRQVGQKMDEWSEKSAKHSNLLREAAKLGCQFYWSYDGYRRHSSSCKKCLLEKHAAAITINIHEWPLPENETTAKAVVFEIDCPRWFSEWRDSTWKLTQDLGRQGSRAGGAVEENILQYSETQPFITNLGHRLTMGSTAKSFLRTHYNGKSFPVSFDELPNGLRFKLLDSNSAIWITDQTEAPAVKRLCTLRLREDVYSNLHYALGSSKHSENKVLADQQICHSALSLHEFVAFGSLRAGERVQWYNIVRELASRNLSMDSPSVGLLFRQAAWELGTWSASTDLRVAHQVFSDRDFRNRLLETLEEQLGSIEGNWNKLNHLQTLVILALRALSLSAESQTSDQAASFLRRCRKVAMAWAEDLNEGLDLQTGPRIQAHQSLLSQFGQVCQMTYALKPRHLCLVLQTPEDMFFLTRSCIIVFENTPSGERNKSQAWIQTTRILHEAEERSRALITQDPSGLTDAIHKSVPTIRITDPWTFGRGSSARWAVNHTCTDGEQQQQQVHYDLLTGELLLDNSPPGRLPDEYSNSSLYKHIFGSRVLKVLPSSLVGFRFMSVRQFGEFQVHFMIDDGELVIQSGRGGRLYRLIPPGRLIGDFPYSLTTNHAHWLNLKDAVLEFRPLDEAWRPQENHWDLSFNRVETRPSVMQRGKCTMVDVRSQLYHELARILSVLDEPKHMVVYLDSDQSIQIEMMRLRLRFFINTQGALQSREMSATVDRDQDIGCFYGLRNKLIVRDTKDHWHRSVVVPFGKVVAVKEKHNSIVHIEPSSESRRIGYFRYSLDRHLYVLRGPPDMQATLYQAYLHAMTSFALRILRQAQLRSTLPLRSDCLDLLGYLANLTPSRAFYPAHLEMAQHGDFLLLVTQILDHAKAFSEFYPSSETNKTTVFRDVRNQGAQHLLERARVRAPGTAAPPTPSEYASRDRGSVASLVRDWPSYGLHCPDLYSTVCSWGYVQVGPLPLRDYTCTQLLQLSFPDTWDKDEDAYILMSLLSMVAFQKTAQLTNIVPLLAIAFSNRFTDLAAPDFPTDDLVTWEIKAALREDCKSFEAPDWRWRESWAEIDNGVQECSQKVEEQWPCDRPSIPWVAHMDHALASAACARLCTTWNHNRIFLNFLRRVQGQLNSHGGVARISSQLPLQPPHPVTAASPAFRLPSLLDRVRSCPLPSIQSLRAPIQLSRPRIDNYHGDNSTSELRNVIEELRDSESHTRQELGMRLSKSFEAMVRRETVFLPESLLVPREVLNSHRRDLVQQRDDCWVAIKETLTASKGLCEAVAQYVLWPPITPFTMVSLLVAKHWQSVPPSWQSILLCLAQSIASLKRCERLIVCWDRHDVEAFYEEAEVSPCSNWDPVAQPEWLLFELENNITIRGQQADIAQCLIKPDSPGNAVMQLNMGEGKTTVITPMAALSLADGSEICRIIVPKPLLRQSWNLLTQQLGGILGRPVYQIPFSRATPIDKGMIRNLRTIYEECKRSRGVLLTLSEHILSFRLVGLDLVSRDLALAQEAIQLERFIQQTCRNIIDESDEILDPKFQLVYTMGTQQCLDGSSDRWQMAQSLLTLVEDQASGLHSRAPSLLDLERRGVRFPIIVIEMMLQTLFENDIYDSACRFVSVTSVTSQDERTLRGAFAEGVIMNRLLFALSGKRWNVDYGLHPSRCMMAGPFRAKGVPSEHAEFGHPDVAVTLTCLSYYYSGLSMEQVKQCEYLNWIARDKSALPEGLRSLTGVNLDDAKTLQEILYPHVQYQKAILDFYLSRVVFPKEAKEFPFKLSTSAWDLPSRPHQPLTTGFIPQRDLPHLLHTNAMVLEILLRPENRDCIQAQSQNGQQLRAEELIRLISNQKQPILELTNQEVAKQWLSQTLTDDADAAIYFDDNDELLSSAFCQRMERCLVFLDQQHARGVDLKLPSNYRAAVTLGPRLTNARLVQACNRMRKIGNGQSVLFIIPPEVSHSVGAPDNLVNSVDVIRWALNQTADTLDTLGPLWASQGLQYHGRVSAWNKLSLEGRALHDMIQAIQEPEAQSLSGLYAPWRTPKHDHLEDYLDKSDPIVHDLLLRVGEDQRKAMLHEEQERQISHEVQREQQVFRPPKVPPAGCYVHPDIRYFVTHGAFPGGRMSEVEPAFRIFRYTSAGQFNFPEGLCPLLHATKDHIRTVTHVANNVDENFLKPVHWILSNAHNSNLLILSQYEVNELLDDIRRSWKTRLHLYSPRRSKTMRAFEGLDFLTIGARFVNCRTPMDTVQDLGFFAGNLYFESYLVYKTFRYFLGMVTERSRDVPAKEVSVEGFVTPQARTEWPVGSPFTSSPLPFLGAVLSIRSKGHGYLQTHVGTILEAVPLGPPSFENAQVGGGSQPKASVS
ncbi:hypothetical protein BP00DRAFT_438002 [Aspergillus indologenus CBS 114.80]|uniref:ubiquitinyl hydrolase 1 n=1 Tax=Aspergillus indologenus CBS 114.80 TaxID=1450541 RepID=A0A2V5I4P6_9EURO|nr:hypothetical protein BP00DRAFT_438002 [Aspergillus indologenus CBS 114.80]